MPELLKTARAQHFQEQGHSFSAFRPTLPVNNRFIFSLQTIKLEEIAALPFHFFIENIFKLKLIVHAIQFAINGKNQTIYGKH